MHGATQLLQVHVPGARAGMLALLSYTLRSLHDAMPWCEVIGGSVHAARAVMRHRQHTQRVGIDKEASCAAFLAMIYGIDWKVPLALVRQRQALQAMGGTLKRLQGTIVAVWPRDQSTWPEGVRRALRDAQLATAGIDRAALLFYSADAYCMLWTNTANGAKVNKGTDAGPVYVGAGDVCGAAGGADVDGPGTDTVRKRSSVQQRHANTAYVRVCDGPRATCSTHTGAQHGFGAMPMTKPDPRWAQLTEPDTPTRASPRNVATSGGGMGSTYQHGQPSPTSAFWPVAVDASAHSALHTPVRPHAKRRRSPAELEAAHAILNIGGQETEHASMPKRVCSHACTTAFHKEQGARAGQDEGDDADAGTDDDKANADADAQPPTLP